MKYTGVDTFEMTRHYAGRRCRECGNIPIDWYNIPTRHAFPSKPACCPECGCGDMQEISVALMLIRRTYQSGIGPFKHTIERVYDAKPVVSWRKDSDGKWVKEARKVFRCRCDAPKRELHLYDTPDGDGRDWICGTCGGQTSEPTPVSVGPWKVHDERTKK